MRVPRQPAYHRRSERPQRSRPRLASLPSWFATTGAHARRSTRARRWPRRVVLGVSLVTSFAVVVTAVVAWAVVRRFDDRITTDATTAAELERYAAQRPPPAAGDAKNVLLIGTDRAEEGGTRRADAVVLLHLAGDRDSATAVSVPRDLMVEIPRCTIPEGGGGTPRRSERQRASFNTAYAVGGVACTIRTFEELTDIRVDHHVTVDFTGFSRIVDALGGVELCLAEPVRDEATGLDLPAGRQTLDGTEALAYVRARKDLADGSDTARVARQQQFLAALARTVADGGMLTNPAKLFPVLDAATSSVTTDTELGSLVKLYDLLREIRSVSSDKFRFITVPRRSDPANPNRDVLAQPAANDLFTRLRRDQPPPRDAAAEAGGTAAPDVCP